MEYPPEIERVAKARGSTNAARQNESLSHFMRDFEVRGKHPTVPAD